MTDQLSTNMTDELTLLLASLKDDIADDYRASEFDEEPGIQVTIASDDGTDWTYQTGDNSFSGGCYGYRHWGVGYLYRDTDCQELAESMVSELFDAIAESA